KYLKTHLLVTAQTRAQLPSSFATRRLGSVRLVNIAGSVELYEVVQPSSMWTKLRDDYERALALFDAGQPAVAADILKGALERSPDDGPTALLLNRCNDTTLPPAPLGDESSSRVWTLPGK
ncbi:MAG TPA: hypothetical protein VG713_03160, partial [Pirellulales bacterium]|nr:hypothetical protein [Pirellulales bacterium]